MLNNIVINYLVLTFVKTAEIKSPKKIGSFSWKTKNTCLNLGPTYTHKLVNSDIICDLTCQNQTNVVKIRC